MKHTPAPYSTAGIIAERNALRSVNAELVAALEMTVRAFNVDEIDPLVAFATIEKARAAIAKATNNQ